jgi:hypothetical protein
VNTRRVVRRALIGALAAFNLGVGAVGSYALYTRIGAPSFARGGTFGAPAERAQAPANGGSHDNAARAPGARTPLRPASAATPGAPARGSAPRSGDAASNPGVVSIPRDGTYRYTGSGHESIQVAGGSPCSWDVREVTSVVKRTSDGEVFDWTYSAQRQQRNIYTYAPHALYTTFVGAAVTCVVRKTDNETYDSPVLRIRTPLVEGAQWHEIGRSSGRTEDFTGRVLAHRTYTVPAGTFDAYEIRFDAKISGDQNGSFTETSWFVPALGAAVWVHATTNVAQSSAHFTSDLTIALTALPS